MHGDSPDDVADVQPELMVDAVVPPKKPLTGMELFLRIVLIAIGIFVGVIVALAIGFRTGLIEIGC